MSTAVASPLSTLNRTLLIRKAVSEPVRSAGRRLGRVVTSAVGVLALVATSIAVLLGVLIGGRAYIASVGAEPVVSQATTVVTAQGVDERETTMRSRTV